MYGCSTHCLGPGCEFWEACENECQDKTASCPRCKELDQ